MMQRAADAGHSVSYSGRQSFLAYRDGRAIVAQVDVDARARQGTQVRVNSQTGPAAAQRIHACAYLVASRRRRAARPARAQLPPQRVTRSKCCRPQRRQW